MNINTVDNAVLKWNNSEDLSYAWNLSYAWSELRDSLEWNRNNEKIVLDNLGEVNLVEAYGGEGQGDQYYLIISITDENNHVTYFKRNGWYASFDGGYLEYDTIEVFPRRKTITVYEDS